MSNVVKLKPKKKQAEFKEGWAALDRYGDRLLDRLYDAIRLADDEAIDEGISEHAADCALVAILSNVLVNVTYTRNTLSPSGLLRLVKEQIKGPSE